MKITTDKEGMVFYEFADSQIADEFCSGLNKANAERYVIDRMIDGISGALLADLQSGKLTAVDALGLEVESAANVLKIAVRFIANLVLDGEKGREKVWELAHQEGLPDDGDWSFNPKTRQFSRKT
jgi:hypothetical protein